MARIKPLKDNIFCTDADFGDQTTQSGIIIKSTMGKETGITPRWFKVFELGPDIDWLNKGEWVLVEYGRWTEGLKVQDERLEPDEQIWKVDPTGCLAVSDSKPQDVNINSIKDAVQKKTL